MKKLLSLTLVLMLLFTTISFTSVSAAPVDGYITGNWKTILKGGFETGDPVPAKQTATGGGQSYNIFQSSYTDGNKLNLGPTGATYASLAIDAPVAAGETFGSNAIVADFSSAGNTKCAIRARIPFAPVVEA